MKRIICLIMLIVLSTSSIGCKEKEQVQEQKNVTTSANNVLNSGTQAFKMITMPDKPYSSNKEGLYELHQNNDYSYNIMYTDYASKKQVYLCAMPNCTHNDPACTSWISVYGRVEIGATNDNIFLIYTGQSINGITAYIEKVDLNGSNRRNLCNFGEGVYIGQGVAANNEHIVVKADTYANNDAGEVVVTQSLLAINSHTGAKETIFETEPATNDWSIAGYSALFFRNVTSDAFIVKTITQKEYETTEDPEETTENMLKSTQHDIYAIPFSGEEPRTLLTFIQEDCREGAYDGGLFYLKKNPNNRYSLSRIDTKTGTETVIIEDFSNTNIETSIPTRPFGDTFMVNQVDDKLLINHFYSKEMLENGNLEYLLTCYAVDINNGDMLEITLSNYYSATGAPIEVVAQFGDKLLVFADIEDIYEEGSTLPMPVKRFGIISVEDYFASNPNYEMIDTIRYY
jgi:hypothetical protein